MQQVSMARSASRIRASVRNAARCAAPWLILLVLTACLGFGPTRRDDVHSHSFKSNLATAFRNCGPGVVTQMSDVIYHVASCDQVAIYRCPLYATITNPVCTLDALDASPVPRRQPQPRGPAARPKPTKAQLADADRLFEEGRALAKDGRHVEACVRFVQSDAIEHTFGTAVNLGDCAEREGHPDRAWRLFDDAARKAEHDGMANRAQFARRRAAALAPMLCTVIVTIAHPTLPGLTIHIDERDVPPAPEIRTLVQPGRIEIVVAVPGLPEQRRTLYGAAGSVVSVTMLADLPLPPPRTQGAAGSRDVPVLTHPR
jgi:hypothetical protein